MDGNVEDQPFQVYAMADEVEEASIGHIGDAVAGKCQVIQVRQLCQSIHDRIVESAVVSQTQSLKLVLDGQELNDVLWREKLFGDFNFQDLEIFQL